MRYLPTPAGLLKALVAVLLLLHLAATATAQDDWGDESDSACGGLLDDPQRLAEVLAQVPKYGTSWALVFSDQLGDRAPSAEQQDLSSLSVATLADSPALAMAAELGQPNTTPYPQANAGSAVEDVLAGTIDSALLWAPLAGLAVLELDFDYTLSLLGVGPPAGPGAANAGASAAAAAPLDPCAEEILITLESYGVVPAEKRQPVYIRDLILLPAPERSLDSAHLGAPIYALQCAKCHGVEGIAASDSLAPVDLQISVRRFSWPGFLYIALNGRPQNGMPGFRGAIERQQLEEIYQYVRERSYGTLTVTGNYPVPGSESAAVAQDSSSDP